MDTMPLPPTEQLESSPNAPAELTAPGPRPHLLSIFHELLLQILEHIDVPDVLSVRQVSVYMLTISA
ncbi:uncharacterized protein LAESUDRAFT_721982 [Laetiporus sulphureus 93-53]|uniref:F-box domain-containing protein n=1 Tax=Laetiporus sulphureus 93-53 TaxID=1314785 RepID=A0A165G4S1_9APHY|nr:uncharacterized protein LAESUDRAFT_721982 [Laetiporus sulphureus 93-53]KZT09828.1 hypothetical protein LAESUDRAFT_721982 [Laetiporus sulphureus 93-53]